MTVIPAPKLQAGELRKFDPARVTVRFVLPCVEVAGVTLERTGVGTVVTVIVRTGGLGSVLPALSVTVNEAVYFPALEKVTAPGLAVALLFGEPPRNTQEYPVIDPLGAVPVPENVTDWPGAIVMSEAGLVIDPVGATSVGVFEICTNLATDGTPALFSRKSM